MIGQRLSDLDREEPESKNVDSRRDAKISTSIMTLLDLLSESDLEILNRLLNKLY